MNSSLKENIIFGHIALFWILIFFGGLVWADTNGIWNRAEDLRGGTFGSDEQNVTSFYTFINPVNFNNNLSIGDNTTNYIFTVNGKELQNKISNSCPSGQAITQINDDGSVICGSTTNQFNCVTRSRSLWRYSSGLFGVTACNAGEVRTGGGCKFNLNTGHKRISYSYPTGGQGWLCSSEGTSTSGTGVYVICCS